MDNTQKVKDKIEEKHEMAGLFSELAFNAIHELSNDKNGNSRWTPTEKAMVHAAIGYLTADLAGSETPISTALANGVNVYAVEAIKKDEKLKAYFDDNPALLRLVSIGIGAGIGGLTGDGNADAWSGASSTQNATRWNDQGLDVEQLANQNAKAEEVIKENQKITPPAVTEDEKVQEKINEDTRQFVVDTYDDPRTGQTIVAGSQVIGGGLEFAAGWGMTDTIVGAMGGIPLMLDGSSNLSDGVSKIINTWSGTNYDGNFARKGFIALDKENGEKYYGFSQAMLAIVSLNTRGLQTLNNIAYGNTIKNLDKIQNVTDVINLYSINCDMKKRKVRKNENKITF